MRQVDDQIAYYKARRPARIEVVDSPYVRRHFSEALSRVPVTPDQSVCEWGAGVGRFTALFARIGCDVTAIELSPALGEELDRMAARLPNLKVAIGDIGHLADPLSGRFDVVAGFFVLHHLPEVQAYMSVARKMLKPGGRFVFVEPNPLNPLYPLQISLTPGMRWRSEIGIYRMGRRNVERAAQGAGFSHVTTARYGALPRAPYNLAAKIGAERWPETLTPRLFAPFQVFTGVKADE